MMLPRLCVLELPMCSLRNGIALDYEAPKSANRSVKNNAIRSSE